MRFRSSIARLKFGNFCRRYWIDCMDSQNACQLNVEELDILLRFFCDTELVTRKKVREM